MATDELSSQMRNSMMVFVAKFLFVVLPPLIAVFFYILTMTKNDVEITTKNEITKIEQAHKSNIAGIEQTYQGQIAEMKDLRKRREQTYQSNIAGMKTSHDKVEQTYQSNITHLKASRDRMEQAHKSNIAETEALHDGIKQTHKNNIAEMKRLKARVNACKKDCDKKNLELKISEKRTVSDRFKMNFNVDKKKVEFKFEEIK